MSDDQDFTNLFGTDDEASDIDDRRSQSSSPLPSHQQQQHQQTSQYDNDDNYSDTGSDAIMYKRQKNTVDDLFGSDDEDEDTTKPQQHANKSKRSISDDEQFGGEDQDLDGVNNLYGDEEVADDDYDNARQQQRVEVTLNMPALPIPDSKDGKYYLAKLPRFLDIDMQPFEPESLQLEVQEGLSESDQLESIRQQVESTIRWRQIIDENGNDKIQSNAHFVDWEDGSRSLMIGQECFDVVTKSMGGQEYTFLLAHQTSSGVLESHTQFTDHMTFQPSDIQSLTHRHLTAHIAGKHVKKTRTKMFFTEMDPEKQKQELEAQENERLRAAKKLESQRRRTEYQFEDAGRRQMEYDYGDEDEEEGGRTGGDDTRGSRVGGYAGHGDAYDDDFVVDDEEYDEEEEREREQRLALVKQSGMERYKRSYSDEDDVEEEEDEEEGIEDEEDEDVVVRRTKRRHVESDDE